MLCEPTLMDAYQLLHDGAQALARASAGGIRFDQKKSQQSRVDVKNTIDGLSERLWLSNEGKLWKQKYGRKASIDSNPQLCDILYNELKIPVLKLTAKGDQASVDKDALTQINHPIADTVLAIRKWSKLDDFVKQFQREEVNGYVHSHFGLQSTISYRSSSDHPNFQNIPIRDEELANVIRGLLLPDPDHVIVEIDYGSLEVRICCCYHQDPVMQKYLRGQGDLHKDIACDCFLLKKSQVTKLSRYVAKNRFVFPEFYGSYWKQVASDLWKALRELDLVLTDGTPLKDHLIQALHMPTTESHAKKLAPKYQMLALDMLDNTRELGLEDIQFLIFVNHIKGVEANFWQHRFPVYDQWRRDWYRDYKQQGYLDLKTGFRCKGQFRKNAVLNYPVQGAAFHCLLWSFTQLSRQVLKTRMPVRLLGQIHDSIVASVNPVVLPDFLALANQVMTKDIIQYWPWITVPLEVEAEVTPVNGSWSLKKEVPIVTTV